MKGCGITGNIAKNYGGGINCSKSGLILGNVSMSQNMALYGGAIYMVQSSAMSLVNSILWNNTTDEIYSGGGKNGISISYSDILGGEEGIGTQSDDVLQWLDGNINTDPLFVGSGEHPYMLTAISPCRNAGTPDTTGLFIPLNDLAGGPRIWEDRIDMGAYEWSNVGISDFGFRISDFGIETYPNPFTGSTTFIYRLKESAHVNLWVFDNYGRLVAETVNAFQQEGEQKIEWNAGNLQAGIYCCRLQAGNQVVTSKIIKMK